MFELPPPSQAWAANEMLNILEACVPKWAPGQTLASLGPRDPNTGTSWSKPRSSPIAICIAFNADPNFVKVPIERLLSKAYADSLCDKSIPTRPRRPGRAQRRRQRRHDRAFRRPTAKATWWPGSTATFDGFGSGLTVPGYGFLLHNRGGLFTLDPKSPNVIAPHKRPFNTLAAGFVMKDRPPLMTITLMGGDMQAQGHAQALVNMLDLGANLQQATDMARFRHDQVPNKLEMESELYQLVGAHLQAMGHAVESVNGSRVGGYQSIMFVPTTTACKYGTCCGSCCRSWRLLSSRLRPSQGRPGGWVVTRSSASADKRHLRRHHREELHVGVEREAGFTGGAPGTGGSSSSGVNMMAWHPPTFSPLIDVTTCPIAVN